MGSKIQIKRESETADSGDAKNVENKVTNQSELNTQQMIQLMFNQMQKMREWDEKREKKMREWDEKREKIRKENRELLETKFSELRQENSENLKELRQENSENIKWLDQKSDKNFQKLNKNLELLQPKWDIKGQGEENFVQWENVVEMKEIELEVAVGTVIVEEQNFVIAEKTEIQTFEPVEIEIHDVNVQINNVNDQNLIPNLCVENISNSSKDSVSQPNETCEMVNESVQIHEVDVRNEILKKEMERFKKELCAYQVKEVVCRNLSKFEVKVKLELKRMNVKVEKEVTATFDDVMLQEKMSTTLISSVNQMKQYLCVMCPNVIQVNDMIMWYKKKMGDMGMIRSEENCENDWQRNGESRSAYVAASRAWLFSSLLLQ